MRPAYLTIVICLAAACSGDVPAQSDEIPGGAIVRWALPDRLREISGLALTPDERLLAVTDEEAIVYELDFKTGRLVKAFALGKPTIRNDFEGIAYLDGTVWLMTSKGELYATREGGDGERMAYRRYRTGLGDKCELEGLTEDTSRNALLLVCKNARKSLRVFTWTVEGDSVYETGDVKLPEKDMQQAIDEKRVNPSGIAIDPNTGHWLIITARQRALFELGTDGELIDVIMRLDAGRHPQAEGIAIAKDGRVFIADEGARGKPRLAIYDLANREQ